MSMSQGVENRQVVVVTGASSGIGEATARLFAQRGWVPVLAARSEEKLLSLAAEIAREGGEAFPIAVDITDWADVERLVSDTKQRYGRIDAVVNNAGRGSFGTVATHDLDKLEQLFRINVFAPVAVMRAVVPTMRDQGRGVIVNVSSQIENFPSPFMGSYAATKAALGYLTDAARMELDHHGIVITRVLPNMTRTRFGENIISAGTSDDFEFDPQADFPSWPGASAEVVAEAVWKAVHGNKRTIYVNAGERLIGFFGRSASGPMISVMTWATTRYMPRKGTTTADPRRDAAMVGAVLALTGALGLLTIRKSRRR